MSLVSVLRAVWGTEGLTSSGFGGLWWSSAANEAEGVALRDWEGGVDVELGEGREGEGRVDKGIGDG